MSHQATSAKVEPVGPLTRSCSDPALRLGRWWKLKLNALSFAALFSRRAEIRLRAQVADGTSRAEAARLNRELIENLSGGTGNLDTAVAVAERMAWQLRKCSRALERVGMRQHERSPNIHRALLSAGDGLIGADGNPLYRLAHLPPPQVARITHTLETVITRVEADDRHAAQVHTSPIRGADLAAQVAAAEARLHRGRWWTLEPVTPRTLGPPGQTVTTIPQRANAPPAARLSTGCSGALIAA